MEEAQDHSGGVPPVSGMTSTPTDRIPSDAEYWLALTRLPGIGRVTALRLVQAYHTPREALRASDNEWRAAKLIREGTSTSSHRSKALAWAKDQLDLLVKSPWSMRVYGAANYPTGLSVLTHPSLFLFVQGTIPDAPTIAIVGSRRSTDYGLQVTRDLAADLATAGVTVVSGFARGVDTAAHTATIDANGATVAVWGCGPDIVYPAENKPLIPRLLERGGLVTEFPFGTPPEPQNFPVRNRLIAGLASGVLVTQAQGRSGALLTAQQALDQGKDVYAVPGEIGRAQSVGTNELIKSGAKMVTSAADILADLGLVAPASPFGIAAQPVVLPSMTPIEARVRDGIGSSPCHVDRIAVSLSLSAAECAAVLVSLELKGIVKQRAGQFYTRTI